MIKYNVYISKESNGFYSALIKEYNIAIEAETEQKVLRDAKSMLKIFIIDDIKEGKRPVKPLSDTFEVMEMIVKEYGMQNSNFIAREISVSDELFNEGANKSVRVNVTMPSYLKELAREANISASEAIQYGLKKKLNLI